MVFFRLCFLTFCAALAMGAAAPAPASAGEVRDVLALPGGAVFVSVDETPASMTASAGAGHITISFQGWSAKPRTLEPFGDAGFSRLVVTADGFVMEGTFSGAQAELRRGGVLIHFGDGVSQSGEGVAEQGAPEGAAQGLASSQGSLQAQEPAGGADTQDAQAMSAYGPGPNPGSAASLAPLPGRVSQPDSDPDAMAQDDPASDGEREPTASPDMPDAAAVPDPAGTPSQSLACEAEAAALADAPWDLDLLTAQADCLVEVGEPRNAAGLYERVLAFQPEHFRAALGLARLRQQDGRHGDAAQLYETAARSALTDGEALGASAAARRAREAAQD